MHQLILTQVPTVVTVNVDAAMTEIITEEMHQLRELIMKTVSTRKSLKDEMSKWYEKYPGERFAKLDNLIFIDNMLSELDSNYKRLWDFHNKADNS